MTKNHITPSDVTVSYSTHLPAVLTHVASKNCVHTTSITSELVADPSIIHIASLSII